MKLFFEWRREYGPMVAGIVTLFSTASYLALVEMFELKPILMTAFVLLSIAVVAYCICGEPSQQEALDSDDIDCVDRVKTHDVPSWETRRE